MSFGFIAFHYPRADHTEEFVGRTRQVRDFLATRPGFVRADVWVTPEGDAVVTSGEFETSETFQAAFGAVAGELGDVVVFDEREVKPRQVHTLLSR
ncbi:hypothetical protein DZF91_07710 [Actinomadura logoneensis]|uniref:ABM domain-containing protein n=1 Tax=Actinomadura logoneensis TaxID=2293572 RepID=A0A372JQZ3_9ACTN|nr:hypothetical protein [Actinomadura logoneensis]RFU42226.1 hypothetical protein DZF91_07710 [Actinomadura logoneensis]